MKTSQKLTHIMSEIHCICSSSTKFYIQVYRFMLTLLSFCISGLPDMIVNKEVITWLYMSIVAKNDEQEKLILSRSRFDAAIYLTIDVIG